MKKTELAKALGVSRATFFRWQKQGILEQKLAELQKEKAIVNESITAKELLEHLKEIESKLEALKNMLQSVSDMLQKVSSQSQGVSIRPQVVSNKSQIVSKILRENMPESELAKILDIPRRTLNDKVLSGKVKAVKINGKNYIPKEEALKLIFKKVFDELNLINNYGNSVPVPAFKEAVKKYLDISDEDIDKVLLDLDTQEVIYLQTLDRPAEFQDSDKGIKFGDRVLYFITWQEK
jgi:predicted site-specific integrase-resolvase